MHIAYRMLMKEEHLVSLFLMDDFNFPNVKRSECPTLLGMTHRKQAQMESLLHLTNTLLMVQQGRITS